MMGFNKYKYLNVIKYDENIRNELILIKRTFILNRTYV